MKELLEGILRIIDKPLELAEARLASLDSALRWRYWKDVLLISLLGALFLWAALRFEEFLVELLLATKLEFPQWLGEVLHHPLRVLFAGFMAPLVIVLKLLVESRRERRRLQSELAELKRQQVQLLEPSVAGAMIQRALAACKDDEPFRSILIALTPSNQELRAKLESLSRETLEKLDIIHHLFRMPVKIQDALANFMSLDLLKQDWGELYMTFAIELQLAPWAHAAQKHRFVFIRDYDEIACFYGSDASRDAGFQGRLEKDLEAILGLVNGILYSVMYKDYAVWRQESYLRSNRQLLIRAKAKAKPPDLKRLFVFEEESLSDEQCFKSLVIGANWHQNHHYKCRFLARTKKNAGDILVQDRPPFLASCLVNATIIEMEQEFEAAHPNSPRRYVYRCESDPDLVAEYSRQFTRAWINVLAEEPPAFLARCERLNDLWFREAAKEYEDLLRLAGGDLTMAGIA